MAVASLEDSLHSHEEERLGLHRAGPEQQYTLLGTCRKHKWRRPSPAGSLNFMAPEAKPQLPDGPGCGYQTQPGLALSLSVECSPLTTQPPSRQSHTL